MMRRQLVTALAVVLASNALALAQGASRLESRTESSDQFMPTVPIPLDVPFPLPGDKNIVVNFDKVARVVFERPVKSIRVANQYIVNIVPESDRLFGIKGLSPGETTITLENQDGTSSYANVVVVRDLHEVRIHQRTQINQTTGERRSDSSSAIGGYVSMRCNEIKCYDVEPPQPKLPR